jgi:hypothetical protein
MSDTPAARTSSVRRSSVPVVICRPPLGVQPEDLRVLHFADAVEFGIVKQRRGVQHFDQRGGLVGFAYDQGGPSRDNSMVLAQAGIGNSRLSSLMASRSERVRERNSSISRARARV